MLYVRFPLSLRNVEDLLHERGIEISHETVRFWWNRFGPMFAAEIRNEICLGGMCQSVPTVAQVPSRCDALYSAAAEAKACFAYEAYFESCRDHSLAPIADGYLKQFCQVEVVAEVDEEPTETCSQDAKLCDDEQICSWATSNGLWDTSSNKQLHNQEAKNRGLECGVESPAKVDKKTCSISSPKICTDIHLCSLATHGSQKKFWQEGYPTAIAEAKNRGLTCGVSETSPKKVFDKNDKIEVKKLQKKLNSIGCTSGYPDGVWGRKTQAAVNRFSKTAGLPAAGSNIVSREFTSALFNAKQGFCPKPKLSSNWIVKQVCEKFDQPIISTVKITPTSEGIYNVRSVSEGIDVGTLKTFKNSDKVEFKFGVGTEGELKVLGRGTLSSDKKNFDVRG